MICLNKTKSKTLNHVDFDLSYRNIENAEKVSESPYYYTWKSKWFVKGQIGPINLKP